jgi:hypothetical protein
VNDTFGSVPVCMSRGTGEQTCDRLCTEKGVGCYAVFGGDWIRDGVYGRPVKCSS